MSRTNTLRVKFESPDTRSTDALSNAIHRPFAVITGFEAPRVGPRVGTGPGPLTGTLTNSVVPERRSRRKTSEMPLVSLGTRFPAALEKTTYLPLLVIDA